MNDLYGHVLADRKLGDNLCGHIRIGSEYWSDQCSYIRANRKFHEQMPALDQVPQPVQKYMQPRHTGGRTSGTSRLDATTEMSAAHTDISGVSTKLEASLKHLGTALVASGTMFMMARTLVWRP